MATSSPRRRPLGAAGVDHGISRREAFNVWALVAANSFGGPAGQIAVMHRFLVGERRWISEQRFLHALNYCMLLPGPEAQQLATYIGWLMHGARGGVVAGGLFILPGAIAIFALSLIYAVFGEVPLVSGLLFGLQAAVVAIVAEAVLRIGRRAIKGRTQVLIAAAAFVAIFFLEVPFPLIVVVAGLIGYLGSRRAPAPPTSPEPNATDEDTARAAFIADDGAVVDRKARRSAFTAAAVALSLWLAAVALVVAVAGSDSVFAQLALFFSKNAVVTFGGAYAVLSYVAQEAVTGFGWLQPGEMLTGLGMAETTPGPLIMVVQFVGFMAGYRNAGDMSPLAAAALGSLVTTSVTFLPCFFFIFAGAPFMERLRGNRALAGALAAITAAVVGVILNLAVWFALHTAFGTVDAARLGRVRLLVPRPATIDPVAVLLMAVAAALIFRFQVSVLKTLGACAVLGLLATGLQLLA